MKEQTKDSDAAFLDYQVRVAQSVLILAKEELSKACDMVEQAIKVVATTDKELKEYLEKTK